MSEPQSKSKPYLVGRTSRIHHQRPSTSLVSPIIGYLALLEDFSEGLTGECCARLGSNINEDSISLPVCAAFLLEPDESVCKLLISARRYFSRAVIAHC